MATQFLVIHHTCIALKIILSCTETLCWTVSWVTTKPARMHFKWIHIHETSCVGSTALAWREQHPHVRLGFTPEQSQRCEMLALCWHTSINATCSSVCYEFLIFKRQYFPVSHTKNLGIAILAHCLVVSEALQAKSWYHIVKKNFLIILKYFLVIMRYGAY